MNKRGKVEKRKEGRKLCLLSDYHAIVVTVDHDGPTAPQVDIFLPPIADLEPKQSKFTLSLFKTTRDKHNYSDPHCYILRRKLRIFKNFTQT